MSKLTPFLWYKQNVKEAIELYTQIFKDVKINAINQMPSGDYQWASINILGQEFNLLNGNTDSSFTSSVSFFITCQDQAEVDSYYDAILNSGGKESQCGWVADKFGVWWQIIPRQLSELMQSAQPGAGQRVMQAMMKMRKIIVADLQKAHDAN